MGHALRYYNIPNIESIGAIFLSKHQFEKNIDDNLGKLVNMIWYETFDVNHSNTKTVLGNTAFCRYDLNTFKLCDYCRHLLAQCWYGLGDVASTRDETMQLALNSTTK